MASNKPRRNVSYGMTNALQTIGPIPVVSSRAPSTSDIAELGTVWVNKSTSAAWVLAKVAAGSATWTPTTVNAGATITTGDLTVTAGDFYLTAGDMTASAGSISAAVDISAATGDIEALTGAVIADTDVTAGEQVIAGESVFVAGDEGTGVALNLGLTNVTDTTLSTGAGKVLMKTVNAGDSSGWLKIYIGTDVRYVPFWTNISPT